MFFPSFRNSSFAAADIANFSTAPPKCERGKDGITDGKNRNGFRPVGQKHAMRGAAVHCAIFRLFVRAVTVHGIAAIGAKSDRGGRIFDGEAALAANVFRHGSGCAARGAEIAAVDRAARTSPTARVICRRLCLSAVRAESSVIDRAAFARPPVGRGLRPMGSGVTLSRTVRRLVIAVLLLTLTVKIFGCTRTCILSKSHAHKARHCAA